MMRFRKINKDVKGDSVKSVNLLNTAILSGATFLIIQGSEWVQLIRFGLTTRSSLYGAFFYTIIGAHAIHVFAGLLALLYLHSCTRKANVKNLKSKLDSCGIYWYFVVSIWPILYYLVYLS